MNVTGGLDLIRRRATRSLCLALMVNMVWGLPRTVAAQAAPAADTTREHKNLFTWRDAVLGGSFAALTVAMFPIDRSVATRLQDSSNQANRFFKRASVDVQDIAEPGSVIIGVSLYGIGRVAGWHEMADLGLHGTEALAVSAAVSTLLKGIAGRARPYTAGDTSPRSFRIGRGFSNAAYQSFPSGHSTAAFAAAAVVTSESQRWSKASIWIVAPIMYGGATLVGLSRMYNNDHWASDVVLGAAIGTFSGIKVVRYNHLHPRTLFDRMLLATSIAPDGSGGARLGWSVTR